MQDFEMGIEFPSIYNYFVWLEWRDLADQGRIDDSLVVMGTRSGGGVFYKHMIIAREQVNVPLSFNAEVFVKYLTMCLPPSIKYFYVILCYPRQIPEQRCVVLNGMGWYDGDVGNELKSLMNEKWTYQLKFQNYDHYLYCYKEVISTYYFCTISYTLIPASLNSTNSLHFSLKQSHLAFSPRLQLRL